LTVVLTASLLLNCDNILLIEALKLVSVFKSLIRKL